MLVGIIDYRLGNLRSVFSAIQKVGHKAIISSSAEELQLADKLIFPGVGAFGDGMNNLHRLGLVEPLTRMVLEQKKPILGICLGSQLMTKESFEFGYHKGLGWIDASAIKIKTDNKDLRIPHVGWNNLIQLRENILFNEIPNEALFYYVHSFHVQCNNPDIVIGECEYGMTFTAGFHQNNIYAIQFHPEKSQLYGLNLLKNFITKA